MNREILAAAKPKTNEIDLGEGCTVRIRALSGSGRVAYMKAYEATKESGSLQAANVAAFALCEEDGKPSFDPAKAEDIAFLNDLDGAVLEKIAIEFYKLSGLTQTSVEDAAKN